MPSFNSMQDLEAFILKKIQIAMVDTVAIEVKQLESQNVKETVYNVYSPKEYIRREDNGGLSDVGNMEHETFKAGNMVILNVENKTMSNPNYNPNGKSPFEITGLVEYGDNNGFGEYDYKSSSDYLDPRPFIEKTKQELNNGLARTMLIKGLIKQGISTT
ncbi:MAG TPA: hypothetical protein VIM42_11625 [Clostridium sp.]